jgi:hypothetical protein
MQAPVCEAGGSVQPAHLGAFSIHLHQRCRGVQGVKHVLLELVVVRGWQQYFTSSLASQRQYCLVTLSLLAVRFD